MEILNNIMTLLQKQGKEQQDLTAYLGISKNNFTDWKAGRTKSYRKYLPEIAVFLGVSVDSLLGDASTSNVALTQQEKELLVIFRTLNELEKARILLLANKLANTPDNEKAPKIAAYGGKDDIFNKDKKN